jgi:hypothetical protein
MAFDNLVDTEADIEADTVAVADTVHCINETEFTYPVDSEVLITTISFFCKFQKS